MQAQSGESNQAAQASLAKGPAHWVAWPILSGILFLLLGLLVLKYYEDGMRSRERGRLVSSIVDQQFHQLSSGFGVTVHPEPITPDLRRWLIQESFKPDETPGRLAAKVRQMLRLHADDREFSPVIRQSLKRWVSSLQLWDQEIRQGAHANLLAEARQRYFEAAGYQKIGRSYDASVLHLWTIGLLTRFVDQNPFDARIPEALFMLGVAYLNLGHSLPPQMRRDRILTLCAEMYPDSLWASRSDAIWKEAFSDEI